MHVSNKSAEVHISTDVGHGGKSCCDIGGVVHCEKEARNDLSNKAEAQQGAEVPSRRNV